MTDILKNKCLAISAAVVLHELYNWLAVVSSRLTIVAVHNGTTRLHLSYELTPGFPWSLKVLKSAEILLQDF